MNSHRQTTKNGFTLVEILVSMSIFVILVALVFANYRYGNSAQNLEQAPRELQAKLRFVQNLALTGKDYDGTTVPPAYGIHFSYPGGSEFITFADTNDDKLYIQGTDTILETITMPNKVTMASCEEPPVQTCDTQQSCQCDIIFTAGDASIFIKQQPAADANAKVTFESGVTGKQKTVVVNAQSGIIELGNE